MPLKKETKRKRANSIKDDCGVGEDETNSSGSSDNESDSDNENITINFTGYNAEVCDRNGISLLIRQLYLNDSINLKHLSDLIIKQNNIGCVVKQSLSDDEVDETDSNSIDLSDMDDTVYSVTSVINLSKEKNTKCVQQLIDFIITKAQENATADVVHFINALFNDDSHKLGFIINERFINLPQNIAEPSFCKLISEIRNASKVNPLFKFTYYIFVCKYLKVIGSHIKKKNYTPLEMVDDIIWSNSEEEVFVNEAEVQFDYSVSTNTDTGLCGAWTKYDSEAAHFRKVLIIPANKFKKAVKTHFYKEGTEYNE